MNDPIVVKIGTVVSVEDEADALRIKVSFDSDKTNSLDSLPYCFPLLPKVFQSVPKRGEAVLVITAELNNTSSQRYYIGPVISQPQKMENDPDKRGRGSARSPIQSQKFTGKGLLPSPANFKGDTYGSFPQTNDIAVLGRGQEDIILKYDTVRETSEIDLRAGVRLKPTTPKDGLEGNVIFNSQNPAFIQIKYNHNNALAGETTKKEKDWLNQQQSMIGTLAYSPSTDATEREANGLVNLVADRINLISHKDKNGAFGTAIADNETMITESQMDEIMAKLHKTVYGDELVKLLRLMINAIANHTHPFPMLPPYYVDSVKNASEYDMNKLLSEYVRIS